MVLVINGESQKVPDGLSVGALLDHLAVERARVAVEVDHQVVPKAEYGGRRLSEGSRVEIVEFIGGG